MTVGEFAGKTAYVTGVSGEGSGRSAAIAFARGGANVALVGHADSEGAAETADLVTEAGAEVLRLTADLGDPDQARRSVKDTVSHFGRLDCAFNNVGVVGDHAGIAECSLDNWQQIIGLNLTGVFVSMKYQIRQMLDQGGGAIVNTSSIAGERGLPGQAAYAVSKHGLIGLTRSACADYAAKGVRVNTVAPGSFWSSGFRLWLETEGDPDSLDWVVAQHPIGRIGEAREIADVVVWLCSDAASFVAGQVIPVDGGWTAT